MDTTVIAADFGAAHAVHAKGLACGLFVALFVVGGLVLVVKAFRLVRRGCDPHATRYARPAR